MSTSTITIDDLKSIKDVATAMRVLGLHTPNQECLKIIGKKIGTPFKEALVKITNGHDANNHQKNFVWKITYLLNETVYTSLSSLGFNNVSVEALIDIGQELGPQFKSNLSKALSGDNESKLWINTCINKHSNVSLPIANNREVSESSPAGSKPTHEHYENTSRGVSNVRPIKQEPSIQVETKKTDFFSITCYGSSTALCFHAVTKDNRHTLIVDGANKSGNNINWDDKIVIGLSEDELIELAWVLLGLKPKCQFIGHGVAHDKDFSLENQVDKFFCAVGAKGKNKRAVPITKAGATRLSFLVITQINKNFPSMSFQDVTYMLRIMYSDQSRKVANA